MNYSPPSANPDRLPWLPDDRAPTRIGAFALMLSSAVSIAAIAAGVSYLPWTIRLPYSDQSRPSASAAPEAPQIAPRSPSTAAYGNLQILPEPLSAPPPVQDGMPTTAVEPPISPPQITPPPKTARPVRNVPQAAEVKPAAVSSSKPATGCQLAKTRAAMAVCSNSTVAALDQQHALLYSQSWRYADARKRFLLQRARERFAGHLNGCPTDACTSGIYLAAMREFNGIMSAKLPPPRAATAKPRVNCRFSRRPGKTAVCSDPKLAALDRHQALLYRQSWARAGSSKRAKLLVAHQRLVAGRDKCRTEPCTQGVYLAAMKEVAEVMIEQ